MGSCPLCGREYDEHHRCYDCNSAKCAICYGPTGGFHCRCCQACCDRAMAAASQAGNVIPRRDEGHSEPKRKRNRPELPPTGLFGANTHSYLADELKRRIS